MNLIIQKNSMLQLHLNKGYITLMSVIIVSAMATSIALSLIILGLDSSRSSFALIQSNQAKGLANACAEVALNQIRNSTPYTGGETINLTEGSCSYLVTSLGGQGRNIRAESIVGEVVRRIEIEIDQINPEINILTWQELADF